MIASCLTILASCSESQSNGIPLSYIAVQEDPDGNWSLYSPDGNILCQDEFENIPSGVAEGCFSVKEGDGFTLYHMGKKPEVFGDYEDLFSVGYMHDGLIPVTRKGSRITIVDKNGHQLFEVGPVNETEIVQCDVAYSDGLLRVQTEDHLYGYIDSKGDIAIPPTYTLAYNFSEGLAIVNKNGQQMVIDTKGNLIFKIPEDYYVADNYKDGFVCAHKYDSPVIIYSAKGEMFKCPKSVGTVMNHNSQYYTYLSNDGKMGVMTIKDNRQVIRPIYSSLEFGAPGQFIASKENDNTTKIYILDSDGNRVISVNCKSLRYISGFGYLAYQDETYFFLDKDYKPILNQEFSNTWEKPCNPECADEYDSEYLVNSHYCSTHHLAERLTRFITADGVQECEFGSSPSLYIESPENYLQTAEVSTCHQDYDCVIGRKFLHGDTHLYGYSTKLGFSDRIGIRDFSTSHETIWNPESKLDKINIPLYLS